MVEAKTLLVTATWDPEAKVWVAESEDVPGLITEAPTPAALVAKLEVIIPELLEANRHLLPENYVFDLSIRYLKEEKTPLHFAA